MSELVSISIQQNNNTEFVGTCEGWVGEPVVDTSERRVRENLAEKICEAIEFWDDTSEICVPKGRGEVVRGWLRDKEVACTVAGDVAGELAGERRVVSGVEFVEVSSADKFTQAKELILQEIRKQAPQGASAC